MTMTVTIYTLSHPVTGEVRYVGRTKNKLIRRYAMHVYDARRRGKSHKCRWINSLRKQGLKPIMSVVEELDLPTLEECQDLEQYWIWQFRAAGYRLTNTRDRRFAEHTPKKEGDRNEGCWKEVHQYDLNGSYIASFPNARDAAIVVGAKHRSISTCCNGHRQSHAGYMWSFERKDMNYLITTKGTPVYQYSLQGNFIRLWPKVQRAAEALGLTNASIAGVARGEVSKITAGGFIWSYKPLHNENLPY